MGSDFPKDAELVRSREVSAWEHPHAFWEGGTSLLFSLGPLCLLVQPVGKRCCTNRAHRLTGATFPIRAPWGLTSERKGKDTAEGRGFPGTSSSPWPWAFCKQQPCKPVNSEQTAEGQGGGTQEATEKRNGGEGPPPLPPRPPSSPPQELLPETQGWFVCPQI